MKFLLVLLLLGGGIAAGFYYSGMFTHDPAGQADEVFAKMQKCTTMAQVLAVAEPKKYSVYVKKTITLPGGEQIETWKPGPLMTYDKATLEQRIDSGTVEGGFAFAYIYTDVNRFDVIFDEFGNVQSVERDERIKNLFDM